MDDSSYSNYTAEEGNGLEHGNANIPFKQFSLEFSQAGGGD